MEKRNKSSSEYRGILLPYIPYEILVNILLRVPATSLIRFKAVCKSWHALFSSQEFIRSHLEINRGGADNKKLIKYCCTPGNGWLNCSKNLQLVSLESLLNDTHIMPCNYMMDEEYKNVWMMDSCDGLICLLKKPNHIWIWNPATRRCRKLPMLVPKKPGCLEFIGFGYYEPANDYKVVAIQCPYDDALYDDYDDDHHVDVDDDFVGDDYRRFQVYSLNTHCWETVVKYCQPTYATPKQNCLSGLFFNNKPFWFEHQKTARGLRYYDLATCKFEAIEVEGVVGDNNGGHFKVLVGQLCIGLFKKTTLDFWLIKENGKEYTLTKFFSINKFVTINSSVIVRILDVLHISKKGEILSLVVDKYRKSWLMVYDAKVCSHRVLEIPTMITKAHIHIESLVSI